MTPAARPPAFVFEAASCVGCHACAIACINEHQLAPGTFWRQVVTFNPSRVPGLPTWHLSLACNHCLDAPCLRYCPARATARDDRTGAVVIDEGRCIGCRYCSWVCPYDAPRFDVPRGVMQKCTFCTHRLAAGLGPACASQCPTGALAVGPFDGESTPAQGFPQADIRPAIRFVSRRGVAKTSAGDTAPGELARVGGDTAGSGDVQGGEAASARSAGDAGPPGFDDGVIPVPASKISLRHEWSLVAFTLVAVVSVAWVGGSLLGGPRVRLVPLLALGAAAMASSASHLGRPHRAWRALLNWRRSWLSREVIAWPTFLGVAAMWLAAGAGSTRPGLVAALVGLACLACVDRVYAVMARARRAILDDASAVSAAVFLAGVLAGVPFLALAAGAYRLAAFVQRRGARDRGLPVSWWRHPVLRVGVGLLLPAALWMATPSWWWPACVSCAFLGEALDRADFYASLDVETPARAMARAFVALL